MAYVDQIAAAQAQVYAARGAPAIWRSTQYGDVLVTVLLDQADATETIPGLGRNIGGRNVMRVRVSDIAASMGPAYSSVVAPKKGDLVILNPGPAQEQLTITNAPSRTDRLRLEWTLDCG